MSGAEYDKTIEYDGIRQKVVPTIEKKGLAAVSSSFFAALCSAFGRYDVVHGIGGFVFERLIPSFTNLVFLFMMASGFGMCCGYYQKIVDQKISVEDFYKKRYIKIWPYFALLCALDFMMSPSKESLFEVFANFTLCQGLLPNAKISVIGVSWTLAVIFVFYMLFPFFCFLIGNKKRAWSVAVVALVFNWLCSNYFNAGRTNIVYDAIYFVAGGLVFLYRKELAEFASKYKVIAGAILLILDKFVGGLVNKCRIHNVISFRGWHSE